MLLNHHLRSLKTSFVDLMRETDCPVYLYSFLEKGGGVNFGACCKAKYPNNDFVAAEEQ